MVEFGTKRYFVSGAAALVLTGGLFLASSAAAGGSTVIESFDSSSTTEFGFSFLTPDGQYEATSLDGNPLIKPAGEPFVQTSAAFSGLGFQKTNLQLFQLQSIELLASVLPGQTETVVVETSAPGGVNDEVYNLNNGLTNINIGLSVYDVGVYDATGNAFAMDSARISSAVPEASAWAMMLIGFGSAGVVLRRRRGKPSLS